MRAQRTYGSGKIRSAIGLGLAVTLFGTLGFVLIEDYRWADALYMTVITVSTVGYGEVKPLSDAGRLFASILIIVGFCSLAFVGQALVESILERLWSNRSEAKKMLKTIATLKAHYIICGYGRVGAAAAERFHHGGVPFVIIEKDAENCRRMKDKGYVYLHGDATEDDTLLKAGIKRARGLLSLLNQDPYNLFVVLSARELNPTLHVIARADHRSSEHKILQAGADTVMSPMKTAGEQIADELLLATGRHPSSPAAAATAYEPQWIDVQSGSSMEGKSIAELSAIMGRTVLGHRRRDRDTILPDGALTVAAGDAILVAEPTGAPADNVPAARKQPDKIVIIDDNPVIVRLYNRLFQKAGFHPVTAANGEEGLQKILEIRPLAAVIDYRLPNLSGIEVCRAVRRDPAGKDIRLILFTSDEQAATKDEALLAGADAVVVKSSDAADIIKTVVDILQQGK